MLRRVLFIVMVSAAAFGLAADWPQYRGPARDGVSTETGLLKSWTDGGPEVLWRIELGKGYSGVSLAAGRLYTMFGRGDDEILICLDSTNGKEIWRKRVGPIFKDRFGDGPRSTPTVDGDMVYALSARGRLHALSAKDGADVWSLDLVATHRAEVPTWGVSTSPLVEGDLLLVDVGGKNASVVAFDKKTGKEVWRAGDDKAGYSTPIAITVGERRQILFFTGSGLTAVSPADGKLLWKQAWKTSYDVNAATPVFIPPDRVFVSSGYDVGSAVLRISEGAVQQVWKNREMKNKFQSSVLHQGHLYGFDEKTFKCIDAATGATRWQQRGLGHGSLLYADGHLLALGDQGTLVLVEATFEEYREKARADIFDGKTWTMPTLSGGKLYLRDEKQLVSLKVAG